MRDPSRRSPRSARATATPDFERPLWARLPPGCWGALATLALHLPSLRFGFVRDDHGLIERNVFLRGAFPWRLMIHDFWASAEGASGLWRPFILGSYWLDARLGHGSPALLHGVNLGVHALVTFLVAAAALQWGATPAGAALAGLWFAVMPAHVESVAWISGRTDLICAAFLLGALLLDRRARRRGARWPGVLALTCWALALMSKETAAGFLILIVIADWVDRPGERLVERLRWLAPYAALGLLWFVAHERFSDRPVFPASVQAITLARRGWAGWTMLATDLGFLWPGFPHSPDFMLRLPQGPADPRVIGGALLAVALVLLTLGLAWRRRRIALPLALVWLPVMPAMAVAILRGFGFYGERHAYLPSIGAAWALGLGWDAIARRRTPALRIAAAVAAAGLIGWSGWVSLRLLPAWRSDAAMFEAMTRLQPEYAVGHAGWANALAAQGREPEALREFAIADSLDPNLPEVPLSLATLHARHGEWEKALDQATRAARMDPRRLQARRLQATALLRLGRVAEGRRTLEAILAEVPGEPRAEALLGQVMMTEGKFDEARPLLERAATWVNDDPTLWFTLGTARLQNRDLPGARDALERAVRLEPGYYDGWLRLALACAVQGDVAARDQALERAAALPEARDGRVDQVRKLLAGGAVTPPGGAPSP